MNLRNHVLQSFAVIAALASSPFNAQAESTNVDEVVKKLASGIRAKWDSEGSMLSRWNRDQITDFANRNLSEAYQNTSGVFYPFGGPDVLFPHLFFPNLKTIVLAGLEEVGQLPEATPNRVNQVVIAYRSFFMPVKSKTQHYTYFFTKDMSKQLDGIGTTTMISTGLSVLGATILSVEPYKLGDAPGVKISYRLDGSDRAIYYFRKNIANPISNDFKEFLKQVNVNTTFMKASMYLPLESSFSDVWEIALSSKYLLQSDCGIPYRVLAASPNRSIYLFGSYEKPSNLFGEEKQPSLDLAFTNPDRAEGSPRWMGKIPFPYDYPGALNSNTYEGGAAASNMIYSVKH